MSYRRISFILLVLVAFALSGCDGGDDPTPTPTPKVITGDVTADQIIEDTQTAVSKTVTAACSLCRFGQGADGDCSGVCPAE